ncbi:formin-like protein 1 isoform X1 [Mytilus californianus]|uniref:formin-like protein 1 isoform X1 n=2 Tax=Mytilus californianus TaxID=6549 RepID=UPI002247F5D4|nr:formin-like protein 1 isoform X1 [Mytilus californianus]
MDDKSTDSLQIRKMASPKSPADRQKRRIKDLDEKWKMLFNEKQRPPLYSVEKYIEYLRKFTENPSTNDSSYSKGSTRSNISTGSSRSGTGSEQQISYLLKKLKLDLRMSYDRFLENFISSPNNGLVLLLTLLKNIQKFTRDDMKRTAREKLQSKKRAMIEELECVMCIKFCLRYRDSVKILLDVPYGLENVAEALLSSNVMSRCTALEVMSKVLMEDEGFHRDLECFTYFRLKNCEPVRFKFLINMLMTAGSSAIQVSFQLCCMKFINSLLTSSPDGNTRIFLQSEVESAGLDIKALLSSVEMKSTDEKDELRKEIKDYRNSLLDVDQLLESHETLYKLNIELQQRVFELQAQLQLSRRLQQNQEPDNVVYTNLKQQSPEQETIQGLEELDQLLDSIDSDSDHSFKVQQETSNPDLEPRVINQPIIRRGSNRNWRKSGHPLPVLKRQSKNNIVPLSYKTLNSENSDPKHDYNQNIEPRTEGGERNKTNSGKITFIEKTRADRFSQIQKEIGLPPEIIVECVQSYDIEDIATENVQALFELLPTENEMRNILTLECDLENLGEAEQFLVQMMAVERLEEKLNIMQFVDQYQKTVDRKYQEVSQIKECCKTVIEFKHFKSLLQIIKDYMVDNFYATPLDFKLSFLIELDSTCLEPTKWNILETIVEEICSTHPHLLHWYKDISFEIDEKVSIKSFQPFIDETKRGITAIETEQLKCPSEELSKTHYLVCSRFNSFYEHFQEMDKLFSDVCVLCNENKETIEPADLLANINTFAARFENLVEKLPVRKLSKDIILEPLPDYMSQRETAFQKQTQSKLFSQEIIESDLDTFGLNATKPIDDKERIKNWIVMTTPSQYVDPCVFVEQTYSAKNKDGEKWCKLKHQDSDSGDSAFEGSGGRCLKKYVMTKEESKQQTSTPVMTSNLTNEPPPDYPRSNSPDLVEKQYDDLSSEVSRILQEFEGDLNGYETHLSSPVNRKFYTIRSIIHL